MPSNYHDIDDNDNIHKDLDEIYASEPWLIDKFTGNTITTIGYNAYGQQGEGSVTHRSSPQQVGSLNN
jgi:hypothetical protein